MLALSPRNHLKGTDLMTILYIFYAVLLLGVLIAVHEFGHFIAARLTGIAVKEFSIGFGPKFLQWKSKKHDTLFSFRFIPMGGYCMFYGDTDDDPNGEKTDDPRNYNKAPVWKRMLSVLCGPLMNFVLAFVVAVVLMAGYGVVPSEPMIQGLDAGMAAEAGGLQAGDLLLRIGEVNVSEATSQEISSLIDASQGQPLAFTVLRDGQEVSASVTPFHDQAENRYRIGITLGYHSFAPLPASRIIPAAWDSCVYASGTILNALGKLVTTGEGINQTAGPVGVIQLVAEQTRQGGLEIFLNLMVVISINLGLLNLFPIPGLDGSRLVFMLIEAIRRRPVSQKLESSIHLAGYALLMGLMIFFTFKDVGRLFGGS